MKSSFVFYSGWYEATKQLPVEVRDELLTAIMKYGLFGEEPKELCPVAEGIWLCIKPQMNANRRKYERACNNENKSCTKRNNTPKAVMDEEEREKERSKEKEKEDDHEHAHEHEHEEKKKLNPSDLAKKAALSLVNANDAKKLILVKDMDVRMKAFYDTLVPYVRFYGRTMIRAFYDYWTEPNTSGTKMRFELQKTWSLERRLRNWEKNSMKFGTNKIENDDDGQIIYL
jgi:hypothetical protein